MPKQTPDLNNHILLFSFTLVCSDMDEMGDNFRTPRHNEEQVGDNGSNQVLTEQPRVVTSKRHSSPLDLPAAACPDDWVGYRGKCYLFSKADGTWNEGQSNCSSLNASLAVIDTQKDLDFLQQHKRSPECWIGLCRRDLAQPWRWVDGTEFNNSLFKVEGDGLYVYLNDRPSISLGQNAMKWICSQPDELAKRKQNGALQALLE
ncbi:C-type lectin domain family 2 member B-like isoform X5 [Mauremys mutica]|uniref:C-type lectin domain family 2 member B-like isoform X5 n=1 Tax=Mauremys mutica TaxID=74926 RepID=UPI001D16E2CA|nr:C-type lectin domain family 2 member B-like isoform X5 [Mauremys mutica]